MNNEIFKEFPIEQYKHRYKVSNLGKIWSNAKKDYLKTSFTNENEIFFVNKIKSKQTEQFRVDMIVATSFFLGKNENLYLEHIDEDKTNNKVSNLRWIDVIDYLKNKYDCNWKQIKDYDKYYISTDGSVWSAYSEFIIKQQIVSGYYSVNIGYPNQLFKHIHRLVGINFIENPNNLPVINHKDGNKFNNNLSNHEWVTYLENNLHSINVLKNKPTKNNINPKTDIPSGKEIESLPNYLITKEGYVYSKHSKRYLKNHLNNNGYYRVYLTTSKNESKCFYTHKLVALAYLTKPNDNKIQVNHKNLNRTDNRLENLEWVSISENNKHSIENNPRQYAHLQKKVVCLDKDTNEIIKIYNGIKEASRERGANSGSIVKVCKGIRVTAGNYKWKYYENSV